MNKQVVIAGILGAASAQDCSSAFTKAATAAKAEITATKTALGLKTAGLAVITASELLAFNEVQAKYDTKAGLWTPLKASLTLAETNHQAQVDAKTAASLEETALAGPVSDALGAFTTATGLVTASQVLIDAQALVVVKLVAAVAEHTLEEAVLSTAKKTATTAETIAIQAESDAESAKVLKETEKTREAAAGPPVVLAGQDADNTAKEALVASTLIIYNAATLAETTKWDIYKPLKITFDKADKLAAYLALGCTSASNNASTCVNDDNDPVKALKTIVDDALTAATTAITDAPNSVAIKTDFTALQTPHAEKKSLYQEAVAAQEVTAANVATIVADITALGVTKGLATDAKTAATAAKGTAVDAFNVVTAQLAQSKLDKLRGDVLLGTLTANLVPLSDDVVVKTYLKKIQDDLLAAEVVKKGAADAKIAALLVLKNLADATLARATVTKTFYQGLLDTATASKGVADNLAAANTAALDNCDAELVLADVKLAAFVAECKENGYEKAQAAMKAKMDKDDADAAARLLVVEAYDAKSAFADTGETNTLCGFPAKAADAAQDPRPVCKEGFCCGAAQKFLKDGTKLAIETCQTNANVHTYTYYPPLPASAAVEPTPETWRFQCISGAQKLAAAATAALAASYMMA